MGAAAVPIVIALSAASTAYSVHSGEQQRKDAKKQQGEMKKKQAEQERILNEQKRSESQRKNEAFKIAQNRMRMGGIKSPTILTSPIGLPGNLGQQKTLLGQ